MSTFYMFKNDVSRLNPQQPPIYSFTDKKTATPKNTDKEQVKIIDDTHKNQTSKGMIRLGAKIRNFSSYQLGLDTYKSTILASCKDSTIFLKNNDKKLQSTADKTQRDFSSNLKLVFRRTDSTEMNSTRTDSPRVSTLFTDTPNRVNGIKLFTGDTDRLVDRGFKKITMQSFLQQDRERLQNVVKEKCSQIFDLNRSLAQNKKQYEAKIQHLELQLEKIMKDRNQLTLCLNEKIQIFKKQNQSQRFLNNQLTKQIKQIENQKSRHAFQMTNLDRSLRKQINDLKLSQNNLKTDIQSLNKLCEKNNKENIVLKSLVQSLRGEINSYTFSSSSKNMASLCSQTQSYQQIKPKIQTNNKQDSKGFQPPRKILLLSQIHQRNKNQQLQLQRKTIDSHKKTIDELNRNQQMLEHRIQVLSKVIQECNQDYLKQGLRQINGIFKNKY